MAVSSTEQRAALGIATLVGVGLLIAFTSRVEPVAMLLVRVLVPSALAGLVLLAAYATSEGARLLVSKLTGASQAAPVEGVGSAEEVLFGIVTGVPLYGSLCFVVAAFSLSTVAMASVLAVPVLFGAWRARKAASSWRASANALVDPPVVAACAIVLGIAVCIAQLPPFTLDELAYHLAVPRAYLIEGRVLELPLNSQSYFPLGTESSALVTMALAGTIGAVAHHFVVLGTAVATVALLHIYLTRRAGAGLAALGVLGIATTPALVLVAGTSWVEWPLLGTSLAAMIALDRATERSDDGNALAQLAVATGAGLACKYTFVGLGGGLFAAALWAQRKEPRALRALLRAGVLGTALGATFFVRNALWTGNPLAPFLDPAAPHVSGFHGGQGVLTTLLEYMYAPGMADESVGAALFALACAFVAMLARWRDEPFAAAAFALASSIAVLAMVLGAAGRLLVPFLSIAAVAGCIASARVLEGAPSLLGRMRAVILAIALVQLTFAVTAADSYHPFRVLARDGSDAEYVRAESRLYAPIRWLDGQLPDRSKTLVLGIQELFWFGHRVRGGGNFDGPRVARYLAATDAGALRERLREDGFTHIALYRAHMVVGDHPVSGRRAESVLPLDAHASEVLRELLTRHARAMGEGEGATLFALEGP